MKNFTLQTTFIAFLAFACIPHSYASTSVNQLTIKSTDGVPDGSIPVMEIDNVEIEYKPDGVHVAWTSNNNSSDFIYFIERSTNCQTFFPIALKKGIDIPGNNNVWFGYIDSDPLPGESFYRIRRINLEEEKELVSIEKKVTVINDGTTITPISYSKK